jgi:hypothetical protein
VTTTSRGCSVAKRVVGSSVAQSQEAIVARRAVSVDTDTGGNLIGRERRAGLPNAAHRTTFCSSCEGAPAERLHC